MTNEQARRIAEAAIAARDASRDLRLKVGETAAALIKATEVMIIRPGGVLP